MWILLLLEILLYAHEMIVLIGMDPLNTVSVALPGVNGACTHLRVLSNGNDVEIATGLKIAQGGKDVELTQSVMLPAPVGSTPNTDLFDIRKYNFRSNLYSYDRNYAHSKYTPRDDSGTDIHEYLVTYDVNTSTSFVAAFAGVYVTTSAAPTSGVSDNDRILIAANNTIYRRSGQAWVATGEAFIGAISYNTNGSVRSVFCFRSRQFYDILTRIPVADFARFNDPAASDALTTSSTISSKLFWR